MKRCFLSALIILCGSLAFVGCGDDDDDKPSSSSSSSSSGGACWQCACERTSSDVMQGCADTCDQTVSGAAQANFCNGVPALTQCEQCMMSRCGATPAMCK